MNIFFKELSLHRHQLSELEVKVLDYMMKHQDEIVESSLSSFAENVFVSPATVSRTCKKLGYSGFSEFQYAYTNFQKTNNRLIEKYSDPNEYLNKIIQELHSNIHSYTEDKINKVVEKLFENNRVEIFGVGRTSSVCREGARKLTFAGKLANARSDWDEQRSAARYLDKKDLAILVSVSGETSEVIQYAKKLKDNQVDTISIIGTHNTRLEHSTNYSIILDIVPMYVGEVDMSSHFLISILFDLISIAYMKHTLAAKD